MLNNDLTCISSDPLMSVDNYTGTWYSAVLKHLNSYAPVKTKRVKNDRLPEWMTPDVTEARQLRDHYKRVEDWDNYRKFRNKTKKLISTSKRNFFTDAINKEKDTSFLWKHLRSVNNSRRKQNQIPEELVFDGNTVTNTSEIAHQLNTYFTSISKVFEGLTLPSPDLSKLDAFVHERVPPSVYFSIPKITTSQVSTYLKKLDTTKSAGIDGIGPRILKLAADVVAPSIATLINKSINSGQFPSKMKEARVFPIHKGGSKTDPSNYRPISVLPTVSKIIERHVNNHLVGFLNKYDLIQPNQSGFREKHSCQMTLIKLVDEWTKHIDDGMVVGSIFLDFKKAFDMVDHQILINKLSVV